MTERRTAHRHARLKRGGMTAVLPLARIGRASVVGIGGCLQIAASAFAAPPPGADMSLAPWFHSLQVPGTRNLCCDVSDCRNYPVRADGMHYQVLYEDRWLVVPTEAVSDRTDNPTGHYVTCVQHDHWTNGVPDGPRIMCLFKAPGM
jgi:hypothetical protein